MCVKDFVCYRFDVAASASRRRGVGVGTSARRHVDGLQGGTPTFRNVASVDGRQGCFVYGYTVY